jgi:hypothetical protein
MKKYVTASFLSLLALPLMFGGNSGNGAFYNDYGEHYVNTKNPEVRFDWTNQRMAVPGEGGEHASENSAVIDWGSGSLVDPHDTMP